MELQAQISPSIVRSAGFPPILPFKLSSQRMPAKYRTIFFSLVIIVILLHLTTVHVMPERKREYWEGILLLENLTGRKMGMPAHLTKLDLHWACASIKHFWAC